MLTLERKEGEIISITHGSETLEVNVSLIRNNKVKLTFKGLENFEIWREEVDKSITETILRHS